MKILMFISFLIINFIKQTFQNFKKSFKMSYLFSKDLTVYIEEYRKALWNLWLLTNKTYMFAFPYDFDSTTPEDQVISKVKSIFEQTIKCLQNKNNLLFLDLSELLNGYYTNFHKGLLENGLISETFISLLDILKKSSKFKVLVVHPSVNRSIINQIKTRLNEAHITIASEEQSRLREIGYSFNETSNHIIDCLMKYFDDAFYVDIIYQMTNYEYGEPYRCCDK